MNTKLERRPNSMSGPVIEHRPWVGSDYCHGIDGARYAIVGYSHWFGDEDHDCNDATIIDIETRVLAGTAPKFYTYIRNYFGFLDHRDFWQKVMFFNFIPSSIGDGNNRFARATVDQVTAARARLATLLGEHKPAKALVFSKKAWESFPPTREEATKYSGKPLADFPGFTWGTYEAGDGTTAAYGLKHPQGASGPLMRRAVDYIRAQPVVTC
ncbi:MAG: hypothetical protein ABI056_07090 [Caulobacteraceae bacterium]